MPGTTSGHYESHTADSYESAYFYSPGEYTYYLRDMVKQVLHLQSSSSLPSSSSTIRRRLIDIGGGTGNFTRMILEDVPNIEGVVIDPFLEAGGSDTRSTGGDMQFVKASAEDFAETASSSNGGEWWKGGYHYILMKEVVHHFPYDARSDIFRGLRSGLATTNQESNVGPSLLIVTRPQIDIDYPLWPAARQVWTANQPSASDIESDLAIAGFQDVQSKIQTYPASIKLDRWLDMVQSRFWSTFANFSDGELEAACDLIQEEAKSKTDGDGVVHFEDRLVFITAR
uniref:O-methyltransferase domain-containing protein n=1 Tax=Minutocellus polymorphus TaxID=265543 RepID=A0A7S0AF73_9STRA